MSAGDDTAPDDADARVIDGVRQEAAYGVVTQWRAQMLLDLVDRLRSEVAALTAERDRLRGRTHEIQAEEMRKRSDLDREASSWRNMYACAESMVADLTAEWAAAEHAVPGSFWRMTSWNNRATLFRLVGERDRAVRRAQDMQTAGDALAIASDDLRFRWESITGWSSAPVLDRLDAWRSVAGGGG